MVLDPQEVEVICTYGLKNESLSKTVLSQPEAYKLKFATDFFINRRDEAMDLFNTHLTPEFMKKYENNANKTDDIDTLYNRYGVNFVNNEMKRYPSSGNSFSSSSSTEYAKKYEDLKKSIRDYEQAIHKNAGDMDTLAFASILPELTDWENNDYSTKDFSSLIDEYKTFKTKPASKRVPKDFKTSLRIFKSQKMRIKKDKTIEGVMGKTNTNNYIRALEKMEEEIEKKEEEEEEI